MKPPIKRVASTDSSLEQRTNGTTTSTSTPTTTGESISPLQTNGQIQKPNGLPGPPQDPRPKKKPKPPPRPKPGASLFIPSKKVRLSPSLPPTYADHSAEATSRRRSSGSEQETTLDYEYTPVFPAHWLISTSILLANTSNIYLASYHTFTYNLSVSIASTK